MDLSEGIDAFAFKLKSQFSTYDDSIVRKVKSYLVNALKDKTISELTQDEVEDIKKSLIVSNNEHSYRTRLYWAFFNDLIFELEMSGLLKCPPIKYQFKMSRKLIFTSYGQILEDIKMIQSLHDYLIKLPQFTVSAAPVSKRTNGNEEATEYLCSFIAAAAIFGKVSFHNFPKSIANLRISDMEILILITDIFFLFLRRRIFIVAFVFVRSSLLLEKLGNQTNLSFSLFLMRAGLLQRIILCLFFLSG